MTRCVLALVALLGASWAQTEGFDKEAVALLYHKMSGEPLDFQAVAGMSEAVRRAAGFDRPDAIKAEVERLKSQLAAANPAQEFTIRVSDSISDYDHDRGEFSILLFTPGHFVPVQAFRQEYQLAFANAEGARAIPMPKDEAREFDARLNRNARAVTDEIHFRVVGKGDPGAVTGARVIRAEITSTRLVDRAGRVVFTSKVAPYRAAGGAFDIKKLDVAGLRVGVKGRDLEATVNRLFGLATRRKAGQNAEGYATTLVVNEMGCMKVFGSRPNTGPGAVCVTAMLDGDDVVRSIRIERVFDYLDPEIFRKGLTRKYGPVASASGSAGGLSLGWGPEVKASPSGSYNALTASYTANDDFETRSSNRIPDIRLSMRLVDAQWISEHRRR